MTSIKQRLHGGKRPSKDFAMTLTDSCMNLDAPATDGQRIEVVANGLHVWRGAQVAVDTTLVSALQRDGQPGAGAGVAAGHSAQTPHVP